MPGFRYRWRLLPLWLGLVALVPGCAGSSSTSKRCTGTEPLCFQNCGGEAVSPSCSDGKWKCPPGTSLAGHCDCPDPQPFVCCDVNGKHAAICPLGAQATCWPGQTQTDIATGCKPGCEKTGCSAGQYCHFADDACGTKMTGQCLAPPATCPPDDAPVCGCDGKVYANACEAARAGVNLGTHCTLPSNEMACGAHVCRIGKEFCLDTLTYSVGADQYECQPLPAKCTTPPDCSCLADYDCGSGSSSVGPDCGEVSGPGKLKLTCYVQ